MCISNAPTPTGHSDFVWTSLSHHHFHHYRIAGPLARLPVVTARNSANGRWCVADDSINVMLSTNMATRLNTLSDEMHGIKFKPGMKIRHRTGHP
jgi:hypothetical protein